MKSFINKRSKLLGSICILELVLSLYYLIYFNYLDRLNYFESLNNKTNDLALVFENMYTSTFWGTLIIIISLITIFSLIAYIYNNKKFQLISCFLWVILLILAINIKDSFFNNIMTLSIFIPIIGVNIWAFIVLHKKIEIN